MQQYILQIIYLIGSVTFILGLKYLGNPSTARKGNLIAAFGMGLAIFGTIFLYTDSNGEHLGNLGFIFGALLVGTVVGWLAAKKVQMTAMPEMVSLFNGMGGANSDILPQPILPILWLMALISLVRYQKDFYLQSSLEW
jgi:NAD(P) transhydrogenase subunit beta